MEALVFDTYVKNKQGQLMHFDIVVPKDTKEEDVLSFGKEWLQKRGEEVMQFTTNECRFCHIEQATEEMILNFKVHGYHIIEMEGC